MKTFRRGRDGLCHKEESFIEAVFLLLALCHSWCRCALSFLWLTANSRVVKCCASCKCHAFKWTGFCTARFLDYITASLLNFSLARLFLSGQKRADKNKQSCFLHAPSPPGPSPCSLLGPLLPLFCLSPQQPGWATAAVDWVWLTK